MSQSESADLSCLTMIIYFMLNLNFVSSVSVFEFYSKYLPKIGKFFFFFLHLSIFKVGSAFMTYFTLYFLLKSE